MADKTVALKITGRVQGVGYRQWMVEEARARGLRGWVRNRAAGWVEALVQGPDARVDDLVAACRHGPGPAVVLAVEETAPDTVEPAAGKGFAVLGTR